jgi:hypothetical protein
MFNDSQNILNIKQPKHFAYKLPFPPIGIILLHQDWGSYPLSKINKSLTCIHNPSSTSFVPKGER